MPRSTASMPSARPTANNSSPTPATPLPERSSSSRRPWWPGAGWTAHYTSWRATTCRSRAIGRASKRRANGVSRFRSRCASATAPTRSTPSSTIGTKRGASCPSPRTAWSSRSTTSPCAASWASRPRPPSGPSPTNSRPSRPRRASTAYRSRWAAREPSRLWQTSNRCCWPEPPYGARRCTTPSRWPSWTSAQATRFTSKKAAKSSRK